MLSEHGIMFSHGHGTQRLHRLIFTNGKYLAAIDVMKSLAGLRKTFWFALDYVLIPLPQKQQVSSRRREDPINLNFAKNEGTEQHVLLEGRGY
jgi:hypothetical protein